MSLAADDRTLSPGTVAEQGERALAALRAELERRWHQALGEIAPRLSDQFGDRLHAVWLNGLALGRDQAVVVVLADPTAADAGTVRSAFDAEWRLDVQVEDAEEWERHRKWPGFPQHRIAQEGFALFQRLA